MALYNLSTDNIDGAVKQKAETDTVYQTNQNYS